MPDYIVQPDIREILDRTLERQRMVFADRLEKSAKREEKDDE
jgi:hypothetical protein